MNAAGAGERLRLVTATSSAWCPGTGSLLRDRSARTEKHACHVRLTIYNLTAGTFYPIRAGVSREKLTTFEYPSAIAFTCEVFES